MENMNMKVANLKEKLEALKKEVENMANDCYKTELDLSCKFAKLADEDWSPEFYKTGQLMAQAKGNYNSLCAMKDTLSAVYWQLNNVFDIEDEF